MYRSQPITKVRQGRNLKLEPERNSTYKLAFSGFLNYLSSAASPTCQWMAPPFNRLSPLTPINQQLRKYNGSNSTLEAPFSQVTPGWCQDDSRKLWQKVLQNLTWMIIRINANWVAWLCEHHAVYRGGTHRSTGRIPRLLLWRLSVPS